MKIEKVTAPEQRAERDNWMVNWHRVAEDDDSTIAYCPDRMTARAVIEAEETRRYLVARCQRTCPTRSVMQVGAEHHEPNCPAYDLGLID